MEHNTLFKLVYTFILGIVIALLFGVGIAAFYEAPKPPEYSVPASYYKDTGPTPEELKVQQAQQQQYDTEMKAFNKDRSSYEKNVSIVLLSLAVLSVVVAFVVTKRLGFLSDGILLGGLLTLLHGLMRGFSADDNKYLFVATLVSVVVVLYLGYRRFLNQPKMHRSKK